MEEGGGVGLILTRIIHTITKMIVYEREKKLPFPNLALLIYLAKNTDKLIKESTKRRGGGKDITFMIK